MDGRRLGVLGLVGFLAFLSGCGQKKVSEPFSQNGPKGAVHKRVLAPFPGTDSCGTIQGRVTWLGPVPKVPPFKAHSEGFFGKEPLKGLVRENPNAPLIDGESGGVGQAVVYLRTPAPAQGRPWDLAKVRIEHKGFRLGVFQGEEAVRVGFVRRGDEVAMVSRDKEYHVLQGRGADFFSFTLVDQDRPRLRRLDRPGLVELKSGAGYYWMRAYLFVADHPYFARTDARGRFRLVAVPPGKYRLACWLPSWNIDRHERDPESSLVTRVFFAAPLEQEQEIVVETRRNQTVDFQLPKRGQH